MAKPKEVIEINRKKRNTWQHLKHETGGICTQRDTAIRQSKRIAGLYPPKGDAGVAHKHRAGKRTKVTLLRIITKEIQLKWNSGHDLRGKNPSTEHKNIMITQNYITRFNIPISKPKMNTLNTKQQFKSSTMAVSSQQ